jgi:hypothetical protein
LSHTTRLDRSAMRRKISARGSRLLLRASPSTITVVCGVIALHPSSSKSASELP